jgi:hypothetical protein
MATHSKCNQQINNFLFIFHFLDKIGKQKLNVIFSFHFCSSAFHILTLFFFSSYFKLFIKLCAEIIEFKKID